MAFSFTPACYQNVRTLSIHDDAAALSYFDPDNVSRAGSRGSMTGGF